MWFTKADRNITPNRENVCYYSDIVTFNRQTVENPSCNSLIEKIVATNIVWNDIIIYDLNAVLIYFGFTQF